MEIRTNQTLNVNGSEKKVFQKRRDFSAKKTYIVFEDREEIEEQALIKLLKSEKNEENPIEEDNENVNVDNEESELAELKLKYKHATGKEVPKNKSKDAEWLAERIKEAEEEKNEENPIEENTESQQD